MATLPLPLPPNSASLLRHSKPQTHSNSPIKPANVNTTTHHSQLGRISPLYRHGLAEPDLDLYGQILQWCVQERALDVSLQIHAHLVKQGTESEYLDTKLLILYSKCGVSDAAKALFCQLRSRNVFSWAAIIALHSRTGRFEEAVLCYIQMLESGFFPDNFVVPNALKACGVLGWLAFGKGVHGYVVKMMGFDGCVFVSTSLADMYGKCGVLGDAQKVFDGMAERSVVAWNSMIGVYARNGMNREAIRLFHKMMVEGVKLSSVALAGFLSACADLDAVEEGIQGHALAILGGFELDAILGSNIMNFYSKVGMVEEAERVFRKMVSRDVVTWNSIISIYVQFGQVEKAIEMFHLMREENLRFDCMTLSSLLTVAADTRDVRLGMEGHGYCIKNNFDFDVFLSSGIIDMYAKCGRMEYARRVFDSTTEKDIVVWNTMLAAYAELGLSGESLKLFFQMQLGSPPPNVVSWNSVIFGFFQNGQVIEAQNMFSEMQSFGIKPNLITWTTVISGLAQNGLGNEAIQVFQQMLKAGIRPNSTSITSALSACTNIALLKHGKAIHGYVIRHGMSLSLHMTTSILDMYAKCGTLDNAICVFTMSPQKQMPVYNAMISAYASHGQACEALALFKQLEKEGMVPDHVTITSVLSACSHARLLKEGLQVFNYVVSKLQMKPSKEHYGCLVKLLADSGQLDEAFRIVMTMPGNPDAHILGSLLAACRQNHDIKLAGYVAEWLLNLDPTNSGNYVAFSNVCATLGRWDKVSNIRGLMKEKGIRKIPGCSWIEVGRELHLFIANDKSHPEKEEIYMMLDLLGLH